MDKAIKILFIDDENSILSSIKRSLHKWFKTVELEPLFAQSGEEAMMRLKEHHKDIGIIVSDQKMPALNGNKLIDLIKDWYPDIVAIILSGHSDIQDMEEIINSTAFSFIHKPWETSKLQDEILKAKNHYNLRVENRILKEQIAEELLLAGDFQKTIMANNLNSEFPIPIKVTYLPCKSTGVSGDYYEIIQISDQRLVVLLGDVAGHGIKPGFISMALKSIIRFEYFNDGSSTKDFSPSKFTNWLNVRVCNYLQEFPDMFITFTALFVDLKQMQCTFCNSGQPAPIVLEKGSIDSIKNNNMVLGISEFNNYTEQAVPITKDSKIFLCSDGIYPTGSGKNYNLEDLYKALQNQYRSLDNHTLLLNSISQDFLENDIDDDITFITMEFDTV